MENTNELMPILTVTKTGKTGYTLTYSIPFDIYMNLTNIELKEIIIGLNRK